MAQTFLVNTNTPAEINRVLQLIQKQARLDDTNTATTVVKTVSQGGVSGGTGGGVSGFVFEPIRNDDGTVETDTNGFAVIRRRVL